MNHFSHVKMCSLLVRAILAPYKHLPGSICSETMIFGCSLEGLFSVAVFHCCNASDEICFFQVECLMMCGNCSGQRAAGEDLK